MSDRDAHAIMRLTVFQLGILLKTNCSPRWTAWQLAKVCEKLGAGEILLNCIDRDGTNSGFGLELINHIRDNVSIPVVASSGAGKVEHFSCKTRLHDMEPRCVV